MLLNASSKATLVLVETCSVVQISGFSQWFWHIQTWKSSAYSKAIAQKVLECFCVALFNNSWRSAGWKDPWHLYQRTLCYFIHFLSVLSHKKRWPFFSLFSPLLSFRFRFLDQSSFLKGSALFLSHFSPFIVSITCVLIICRVPLDACLTCTFFAQMFSCLK